MSSYHDVCLGLRYLHSRDPPLVHRDLTPNNILLGGHLEAKITDLGVTKAIQKDSKVTMTKIPGTPDFMPPEALSTRPIYGTSLDVFSFGGVVLYTAVQRWPELDEREQFNGESGKFEVISEVKRRQNHLDILAIRNTDLQRLVVSCLNDVAKERPEVMEVSVEIKRIKHDCDSDDKISPIAWLAMKSGQAVSEEKKVCCHVLTCPNDIMRLAY